MDTATYNLENDHVYILRLIDVMEIMSVSENLNPDDVDKVIFLIRNFADGLHHAKEENLLFPKMVEKGYSFEMGPVAVMMHEHVDGRNFVKGMADANLKLRSGDIDASAEVVANMVGYAELLRAHINKENNVLFRMADNVFSADEQKNLLDKFGVLDADKSNGMSSADYIALIEELETSLRG